MARPVSHSAHHAKAMHHMKQAEKHQAHAKKHLEKAKPAPGYKGVEKPIGKMSLHRKK